MKPELRPISITIVDFLGVFLPGTIWLVLFVTAGNLLMRSKMIWNGDLTVITPISVAIYLLKEINLIPLLLVSVLVGYSIKPLTTKFADGFTSRFLHYFEPLYIKYKKTSEMSKTFNKNLDNKPNDEKVMTYKNYQFPLHNYKLPYKKDHEDKNYYIPIVKIVNKIIDGDEKTEILTELPNSNSQPFSICKRILREISPSLWEEAERREAEVRMLGSFFLSAIFNLICSIYYLITIHFQSADAWIWFIVSLPIVLYLGASFIKQKKAEVAYVYMNFLVANSEFLKKLKTDSNAT